MIVELVREDERTSLLALAVHTGLFTAEDAEGLLGGVLDALASGELPDGHAAVACRERPRGPAAGWAYFAPDQYAENVWNVWWIGTSPDHHGTGVAQILLSHVEQTALESGANTGSTVAKRRPYCSRLSGVSRRCCIRIVFVSASPSSRP